MIKLLLLTPLLFLAVFIHPGPVSAQTLDTCDEKSYCERNADGSEKGFIRKSGCRIDAKFEKECADMEERFGKGCRESTRKVCVCHYETIVANSCGNPGGTKDVSNNLDSVFGRIAPPIPGLNTGIMAINGVIGKVIQLIYMIAGIGVVFIFLWSGLSLIISGGDKEALGTARKRITWAIIGLVLLALAFPIMRILGEALNIPLFS